MPSAPFLRKMLFEFETFFFCGLPHSVKNSSIAVKQSTLGRGFVLCVEPWSYSMCHIAVVAFSSGKCGIKEKKNSEMYIRCRTMCACAMSA